MNTYGVIFGYFFNGFAFNFLRNSFQISAPKFLASLKKVFTHVTTVITFRKNWNIVKLCFWIISLTLIKALKSRFDQFVKPWVSISSLAAKQLVILNSFTRLTRVFFLFVIVNSQKCDKWDGIYQPCSSSVNSTASSIFCWASFCAFLGFSNVLSMGTL